MDAVFIECFGELTAPRVERTKKHTFIGVDELKHMLRETMGDIPG